MLPADPILTNKPPMVAKRWPETRRPAGQHAHEIAAHADAYQKTPPQACPAVWAEAKDRPGETCHVQ
jgi:hypothetical protein